jgi:hypothetical protein
MRDMMNFTGPGFGSQKFASINVWYFRCRRRAEVKSPRNAAWVSSVNGPGI